MRREHFEQGRLFSVADIPTKKGPRQEPRPHPNFEQPSGGEVIGKYLYHHSSPRNRSSISRQGLMPKDPKRSSAKGMSEEDTGPTPYGVYLGPHGHVAGSPNRDVWAVPADRVRSLRQDPGDYDNYWGFHYTDAGVPPEDLRLIHKGKRQPPRKKRDDW